MIQFIVVSSFFLQDYISFIFLLDFFFVVFSFGVVVFLPPLRCGRAQALLKIKETNSWSHQHLFSAWKSFNFGYYFLHFWISEFKEFVCDHAHPFSLCFSIGHLLFFWSSIFSFIFWVSGILLVMAINLVML